MTRSPNRIHERQYFYKYMKSDIALIVMRTRKLRWSSPLLFNDPFDVTQDLRLDFDEKTLNLTLRKKLVYIIEDEPENLLSPSKELTFMLESIRRGGRDLRDAIIRDLRNDRGDPTLGQINSFSLLKSMWREMVPKQRVLCISELNDVNPMWQHYADAFTGVVLEFSAVDELDSAFLVARPVIYQDAPPIIASPEVWVNCIFGVGGIKFRDLFDQYMYLKTKPWEYEKEWRIVSGARPGENGLYGDYGFHPKEITGIYLGPRCPSDVKREFRDLLINDFAHVRVYESQVDNINARFVFVPVE
jgi:Protein of unknown function (DUF2971)